MNVTSQQLERIVRQVMQELQARYPNLQQPRSSGSTLETRTTQVNTDQPNESPVQPPPPQIQAVQAKVITEELLSKIVADTKELVFPPRAIVTPSGHDFIRRHGLSFRHETLTAATPEQTGDVHHRLALLVHGHHDTAFTLCRQLSSHRTDCEFKSADTLPALIQTTVSRICRGENERVIAFSNQEHRVAAELNRNAKLHAAVVSCDQSARRALSQLPINVICISPEHLNFYQLKNLLNVVI